MKNQSSITRKSIEAIYPLSPMQQGILFHTIYEPGSGDYVIQLSCKCSGALDVAAFERAWSQVIARHSVLRTSFVWQRQGEPLQVVHRQATLVLDQEDWRLLPEAERQQQWEQQLGDDRRRGFELQQAPLMRVHLARVEEQTYWFVWSSHHLLLDGWSLPLLLKEVFSYYEAYSQGRELKLEPVRPYEDYIGWLRQQELTVAEAYWRRRLKGFAGPTPLPLQRNAGGNHAADTGYAEQKKELSVPVTQQLRECGRQQQVTVNTVVQAAWALLLWRYSGEPDLVYGTTVSGRPAELAGVEEMVGLFINTLPVRVQISAEQKVSDWLRQLQTEQAEMRQYEYSPLVAVQGWSEVGPGRALFESIVLFENYPVSAAVKEHNNGLRISNVRSIEQNNYPITVAITPGSRLELMINYYQSRFDPEAIERLIIHLQRLLESMIADPEQPIATVQMLSAAERQQLLVEWNNTERAYPVDKSIHESFAEQAARTPEAIAVVYQADQFTYRDMNSRANQLARYLRRLGAGPEQRVGICVERSAEMMLGLLGILKSGGAYVPLDPAYPGERLGYMLQDAGIKILITQSQLLKRIPEHNAKAVCLDADWSIISKESPEDFTPDIATARADNLAYVIYTSGSTGKPKGVMVSHRNVVNFFTAMDARIGGEQPGAWLAVTSISFDISVLELLWTMTRGFKVVIQPDGDDFYPAGLAVAEQSSATRTIDFSLFYFASDDQPASEDKYRLLLEGARFADQHGFAAVWTPERHFHAFGGLYPNPSVTSAAIAAITERIKIRAGSVVLPLHNPIRVAEEWSVVDNISKGRVGLSFATGWTAEDFALAPDNYADRKAVMFSQIEIVQKLWRGEGAHFRSGTGAETEVKILPRPVQCELPVWITAAGNPETFRMAGEIGANLLTHLLGQSVAELAEKIALYRQSWRQPAHAVPDGREGGHVTLMLHTFVGEDLEVVREKVRQPFYNYLRSSIDLIANLARSLGLDIRSKEFTESDLEALLAHAFDRYFGTSGLMGTPDTCLEMIDQLKAIGVDEIGCLIDFGVDVDSVMSSLHYLDAVRKRSNETEGAPRPDYSFVAQMARHSISHLQCTPSLAKILRLDEEALRAMGSLRKLMIGGEALPSSLAEELSGVLSGELHNMYGPTETTIWSTTHFLERVGKTVPIGRPIANTEIYIVDQQGEALPAGVPGELLIGGAGVGRGYLQRPELTAEKFTPNPFGQKPGERLYRTGDLARYHPNGDIEFLGRLDQQVKLRGYRIELQEIEAVLNQHPAVAESVVIAREHDEGGQSLAAYLVAVPGQTLAIQELRGYLEEQLPAYMVPAGFGFLDALPLTPNGKVDRQALSAFDAAGVMENRSPVFPRNPTEEILAGIWCELLELERVGVYDNFFDLGGHSLLAILLVSRVRQLCRIELPLRQIFESPTIAELSKSIEAADGAGENASLPPIKPADRDLQLPLSFAQQRLWFLNQLEPGNVAYNVPAVLRLTGVLDVLAMERALTEVVRRHESLRTSFSSVDRQAIQVVSPPLFLPLPVTDLSTLSDDERDAHWRRLSVEEAGRPFDLAAGPLLRVKLLRLGEAEHVLLLTMHQIVCDGWSMGVMTREVGSLYEAFTLGEPSPLPELPIQYADYAVWQREWRQGELFAQQFAYWKQQLEDAPPVLDLPTDYLRPSVQSYNGARQVIRFSPDLSRAITAFSRRFGLTLFMSLLTAFYALLFRHSGQSRIVIGTLLANRTRAEIEPLIGFFLNAQPMCMSLSPLLTWKELTDRVRGVALGAYAHQDLPFEKLVEELRPERLMSHHPLFQVMLILQNAPRAELQLRELTLRSEEIDAGIAVVDLTLSLTETKDGLRGWFEYNTDLFEASTIRRLADHYERLVETMVSEPGQRITQAPMLTRAEREQMLRHWNDTRREYPHQSSFAQLFEAQVRRMPEATAVRCGSQTVSYRELNRRADETARGLIDQGIEAEQVAAIVMERGVEFVIALLAVFKTGGAFLPLDPNLPPQRLARLLKRSRTPVVVVGDSSLRKWAQVREEMSVEERVEVVEIGRLSRAHEAEDERKVAGARTPEEMSGAPPRTVGRNVAYVIYTSGSTGEPKGVMIEQRGMINHLCAKINDLGLNERDVVAQTAAVSFDISIWQFLAALLVGGEVRIIADEVAHDASRLMQEVSELGVTVWETVPSMLSAVLQAEEQVAAEKGPNASRGAGALRWLVVTGEALSGALIKRWQTRYPQVEMINAYGPTECSDDVTHERVGRVDSRERVAIGRPVQNTEVYVLDQEMEIVPVGVNGEVCIGGVGVGRGYLGEPGQTAELFVPDPYTEKKGARLYLTGDVGRYRSDGRIEYVGRRDEQVKVRGYRIELGEVETVLRAHPGVKEAVVVMREPASGDKRLVGYVVMDELRAGEAEDAISQLRGYLKERLPEYMTPSVFVKMEQLPLTPNGKVDRRALPEPEPMSSRATETYAAPRTTVEGMVAGIWSEVLRVERISIHDNFFDLGGHSLLATQVISRAREAFQVEVPLRKLFEQPTVAELTQLIEAEMAQKGSPAPPIKRASRDEPLPLSFAQQRLWFLDQLEPENTAYNLLTVLRLNGPLDLSAMRQSLNEIVRRHEMLRTTFQSLYGKAAQIISPARSLPLPLVDLSQTAPEEREAEVQRLALEEAGNPFDLATGPLLRVKLLRTGEAEHVLFLTMHHIISDAWSMGVLVREAGVLYRAFTDGAPSPLPELAIQYADYAVWQREWLQGEALEQQLAYWKQRLAGSPPVLALPTDYPRPAVQSYRGAQEPISLSDSLTRQIRELSQREGVTLFMALLAVFKVLLFRYTGQADVVVGTPIANRTRSEIEGLIGFFVNAQALRTSLGGEPSWREALQSVRAAALEAYTHQDLPFEKLVEELQPRREMSHHPVFQVTMVLQTTIPLEPEVTGIMLSRVDVDTRTAKFDLSLSLEEESGLLKGTFEYSTDLFAAATISRMVKHYEHLLDAMVRAPAEGITTAPMLGAEEQRQILIGWNDTRKDYPLNNCIHHLFETQVQRSPSAVALVFESQSLTYGELNRRANQLARHLRQLGIAPEMPVGICMDRSLEMVVATLGVLKAGGAYAPLDPTYPAARLNFILEDAEVKLVLTQQHLESVLAGQSVEKISVDSAWAEIGRHSDENIRGGARPDNLAYVIYTSGSTGKQKGVLVAHRGLCNLALDQIRAFGVQASSRVLQFASFSFDASVSEFFKTLLAGATLCMARQRDLLPGVDLLGLLRRQRISMVTLPPSVLAVLPAEQLPDLLTVIAAGEACPPEIVSRWSDGRRLVNAYGPTEVTVCASLAVYTGNDGADEHLKLHIGRPLANTEIYLLDEYLQPAPVGVPGQLHIAGVGLARGYFHQPALTAEKFIPHPFSTGMGARLYRTGDLARYLPDGNIEFLGRLDTQVKLRGYRIELGEIEEVLQQHESVRQAVVMMRAEEQQSKRLVAYVAGAEKPQEIELWPSVAEYFIYDEVLYYAMTNDERRNASYRAAIARAVRNKVVLDIGTGPDAILARFCVEAGASHVYAIELLAESYKTAAVTIERLGLQDRITLIHGDSTTVQLPQSAEVCVSEIVGPIGGVEGAAVILNDARRFLSPTGSIIPRRSRTKIAAVTLPEQFLQAPGFSAITRRYVERIFEQVGHGFDLRLCLKGVGTEHLLSESGIFEDLDFSGAVATEYQRVERMRVTRNGRMDGFLVWLTLETDEEADEIDILQHEHCWLPVYLPVFESGVEVSEGDEIEVQIQGRLSANGLNPDYALRGEVRGDGGRRVEIKYESKHEGAGHEGKGIYGAIFDGGQIKERAERKDVTGAELREHVKKFLPEYMAPAEFVRLRDLPVTARGKVDRAALAKMKIARAGDPADDVAPRTFAEQTMANVWSEVLHLPRVGIHQNFFELGGDSILSIQVVSRAQKAGLLVSARQLFENQTIAALAAVANSASAIVCEQGPVSGAVPLTPIQHWFFEQHLIDPRHFNQAVLLCVDDDLDVELIEQAVKHLLRHHDALRLRFRRGEGGWQQSNAEVEEHAVFSRVDLSKLTAEQVLPALEQAATQVQASLDLERGPLMRVCHMRLGSGYGGRLLWVIHHLAVDGVSWRILLEDLQSVYEQMERGDLVRLSAKSSSYQQWAERLQEYSASAEVRRQQDYWSELRRQESARLPVDYAEAMNSRLGLSTETVVLSEEETRALLQEVPGVYRTQINELLLSALAQCLCRWASAPAIVVDVEGHGREEVMADVNVSRTVGWFTSLYPVRLERAEGSKWEARQIKRVKEQLRGVPDRGIGYGVLRYLSEDEQLREQLRGAAEVSFNYLGQADQVFDKQSRFRAADEGVGLSQSTLGERQYLVEVNAIVAAGQLRLNWSYSEQKHRRATIAAIAGDYVEQLRQLIAHCLSAQAGGYTLADFPLARLDQQWLDERWKQGWQVDDVYGLSPLQQGLLFHSIYAPNAGEYVVQLSYRIDGKLQRGALEQAWRQVLARHQVLRSSYHWDDIAEPVQVVHRGAELRLNQEDWRELTEAEQENRLKEYLAAARERGFELGQAPLMRLALLRLSEESYELVWSFHHVLLDGWSVPLVLKEVLNCYEAFSLGREPQLQPVRPYEDYIVWLRHQDMRRAESYWRERLRGFTEPTPLLARRSPANSLQSSYAEERRRLSVEATDRLQQFTRQQQVTTSVVAQAAWALLLSRYSGQRETVYGATVSGRSAELAGVEDMIGLFINTLPVRVEIRSERRVGEWLRQLQVEQVEMRQYEYSPLVEVQGWSEVGQGRALFDSIVVFENYPVDEVFENYELGDLHRSGRLKISQVQVAEQSHYPISVTVTPSQMLGLRIIYDQGRFEAEAVERMMTHLCRLLESLTVDAERQLWQVEMLSEAERRQILCDWNQTSTPFPHDRCIHHLFEQQVERVPAATALVFMDRQLTYRELNIRANQLAHHLQNAGVTAEVPVAIFMERSLEMIISLLAVLKAGGAYLPLDPAYPATRLSFILADAGARHVLTQQHLTAILPRDAIHVIPVDQDGPDFSAQLQNNCESDVTSDNLAYITYTSGSTGIPKGVCIPHRAVIRLTQAVDYVNLSAEQKVLQLAPLSFDASTFEIWGSLLNGAQLVLMPPEQPSLAQLGAAIEQNQVSTLWLTAGLFHLMVGEQVASLRGVRQLLAGGDVLSVAQVNRLRREAPGCQLINGYGPTENTTFTTSHRVKEQEELDSSVPIGRPITNTQVYILDEEMSVVGVGATGELYAGGEGLARGYLKRPELTAERFVPDSCSGERGARLYGTGDLARYRADGVIEYVGRVDNQIKLRGFRVEVEEVAVTLGEYPGIDESVVVAREDEGEKRLVAYVVSGQSPAPSAAELRSYLKERLPDYMVPSWFVTLEQLPLTSSGKVDRRRLPAPEFSLDSRVHAFVAPRTPIEKMVADIWSGVLKIEQIGAHDNFFELGGHSLLATQILSRIRNLFRLDLPLRILFEHPTVAGVAAGIAAASNPEQAELPAIPRREGSGPLPLSFAQQRLWFLDQLLPGSTVYHIPLALRVIGQLEIGALEQSLSAVVARHEVLRTTFVVVEAEPVQVIGVESGVSVPVTDLSLISVEELEGEVGRLVKEEGERCFDLAAGPLMRVKLVRVSEAEHVLLVTMHHIISDGWSMGVLVREVGQLYEGFSSGQSAALPELEIQYGDYAVWQREWLQGEVLEEQLGYWREQLRDAPGVLELPGDRGRGRVQSYRGGYLPLSLDAGLTAELKGVSERAGVTMFMTLLAAFQVLLGRYSGAEEVVVGTPIANRTRAETEGLIGFFVNLVALRTRLRAGESWEELLGRVREVCLGAYGHQEVPFEKLVEELQPERALSHHPLFQVLLVLQNAPVAELKLRGLRLELVETELTTAKFDLTLGLEESGGGLRGSLGYSSDLFERETMARLMGHYERLLRELSRDPEQIVSRTEMLSAAERGQVLWEWNQTRREYELETCLHHLFEAQAERTPGAVAVVGEGRQLSYGELNGRANQLAHYLRGRGVGAETVVGLCLERSVEMVVTLLAVLKAGGAYLPLDVNWPEGRLNFMIADAGARVLVTRRAEWPGYQRHVNTRPDLARLLTPAVSGEGGREVVWLDEEWEQITGESRANPEVRISGRNLAYVIYTSGSTGRPKGVMIEHRQMVNYLRGISERVGLHSGSRYLMVQPLTVDSSATTIYPSLSGGGSLHVAGREQGIDGEWLASYIREQEIDCLKIAPSHLKALVQEVGVSGLLPREQLIMGGEASQWEFVRQLQAEAGQCRLYNHYGPTEATVGVLVKELGELRELGEERVGGSEGRERGVVGLGRGLANVRVYVLDEELGAVAVGVVGELYLGGECVGRGYLGRSEQTAARFVPDPYSEGGGERLYRTGDLGRYGRAGEIEFVGRRDDQVKVRGHRIELGEVEGVLSEAESVREAAVVVRADQSGEPRLVAYVVVAGGGAEEERRRALRQHLKEHLPEHMMPWAIVELAALPLSAHGKVDRRALPAPTDMRRAMYKAYVAPRNQIEETLAEIWSKMLGLDQVGIDDNFFELGGHSLLATQVVARAREAFQVELPLRIVFEQPTIAGLADAVRGAEVVPSAIVPVSRETRRVKRTKAGKPAGEGTGSG